MLDIVVDRREMKALLGRALQFMGAERAPAETPEPVAVTADAEQR
jgi:hypothetical protein